MHAKGCKCAKPVDYLLLKKSTLTHNKELCKAFCKNKNMIRLKRDKDICISL